MRPMIGFELEEEAAAVTGYGPENVLSLLQFAADAALTRTQGQHPLSLVLLQTEQELRDYQEGQLVLYQKPMRRTSNKLRFWNRVTQRMEEAEQETLFE